MLSTTPHSLKQILSTILLTVSILSWADQPTPETVTAITALENSKLLELDAAAGAAAMAQIKAEINELEFQLALTYPGQVMILRIEGCPTLHRLVNEISHKIDNHPVEFLIFRNTTPQSCMLAVELHPMPGRGLQPALMIGTDALPKLEWLEFVTSLAHEMGHLQAGHLTKKLITEQLVGLAGGAALIAFANSQHAYVSPTVWGKIKDHFKFSFTAKGFATGIGIAAISTGITAYLSRRYEYAADKLSYQAVHQPVALISGLQKQADMLAEKCPTRAQLLRKLEVIGLADHPSLAQRAAYLKQLQAADALASTETTAITA